MKSIKSFLAGTGLAAVLMFPFALVLLHAAVSAAVQEADARAARQIKSLMWQIQPGIRECTRDDNTLNCRHTKRGKTKTVVLATARE